MSATTKTPRRAKAAREGQRNRLAPRRTIRRPRTPAQKVREIILVTFDIDKVDIALATGINPMTLSNVFSDRHRSVENESRVLDYLNGRLAGLDRESRAILSRIGIKSEVTREHLSWPVSGESDG